jgi:hypothetical protein
MPVPLPRHLALPPVKEKRIKLAAACRCELCNGDFSLAELEIHLIRGEEGPAPEPSNDLQRHILVLCTICHREIHRHAVTVPEQREILRSRAGRIRRAIRDILLYRPAPYVSPEDEDLPEEFESVSHDHWGWGT